MSFIQRGLLAVVTAGALTLATLSPASAADAEKGVSLKRFAIPAASAHLFKSSTEAAATPARGRAITPGPSASAFKPTDLEFYLTDAGIAYIRPGVKVTNVKITNVAAGQKPVVEFNLTDQFNQPLDRLGNATPGPIGPSFILARWDASRRYYFPLTMRTRNGVTSPAADQNGTFVDLEMGHSKYTFGTTLPANFDATKTYTLGVYARRTLTPIIGKDYYADNVFVDFRPDGGTATAVWNAMAVANSCNKCHDPIATHGGTRRDVKLCMLCHNDQINSDATTGNTFNGKVFFHKLHMGSSLPSVKAGKAYAAGGDWSTVVFPQDIRNCTTCHDPKAGESAIWYTNPSRDACGSCHDDVNFATGANHAGGKVAPQTDDSNCAKCHTPQGTQEFDASIKGAHTIPLKSTQLKGIKATVVSVSNFAAGKKPTAVFKLTNNDGTAIDGTKLNAFSPKFGGPTTSYKTYFSESGLANGTNKNPGTFDPATGNTSYTFTNALPADASGTWAVTVDIERAFSLVRGDGQPNITGTNESVLNPVYYAAVDGKAVTPRRVSVTIEQCNVCHDSLSLHGGQRNAAVECVICHNPTKGDEDRRPANAGLVESVSFQRLIHRIHTGENLTQNFTVIGFGGSVNTFNDVRFPGSITDCVKCHSTTSYQLPLATGIDSVKTLRDYFSPQGPATAACLGCHDNSDAAAHAYLNTVTFPGSTIPAEACATCHGTGKDWAVDKVHAQ